MPGPIIDMTDAAVSRVKELVGRADSDVAGLRVGISPRGCSGMSYVVEYATEARKFEEVIELKDVKIFIDPAAVMFLIGSTMDYETEQFRSGFTFTNPNEKGRCGCGESFHV